MTVQAAVHVIDVGTVELNDLILSSSVVDLAEMQNDVYSRSKSMVWSFVETSGSGYFFRSTGSAFATTFELPEGISKLMLTTRGTDLEIYFIDYATSTTLSVHTHGATEDTVQSSAVISTGLYTIVISVSNPGYLRYGEAVWYESSLP